MRLCCSNQVDQKQSVSEARSTLQQTRVKYAQGPTYNYTAPQPTYQTVPTINYAPTYAPTYGYVAAMLWHSYSADLGGQCTRHIVWCA